MRTTNNYEWHVPTKTDVADIEKVSQTFDEIDEGLKGTMDNVSEELANRYTKSEIAALLEEQDAKIFALKRAAFYMLGDKFTVEGTTAGYVTNSGKDFYFTIPLMKAVYPGINIKFCDPSQEIQLLTIRQNGTYYIGSQYAQTAGFTMKSLRLKENALMCVCTYLGTPPKNLPTNNDPVGVWYTFKLYAEQA